MGKTSYTLSAQEMKGLIEEAARAGAEAYRREQSKNEKKQNKVEITKERLKSYRRVKISLIEDMPEPEEIEDIYFKALEDLMGKETGVETRTERLLKSNAWARQKDLYDIVKLERAVELYRRECDLSKSKEAKRRFDILFYMHIDMQEHPVEEIAELTGAGEKTVYSDLRLAYRAVSDYYLGMQ